MHPGFFGWWKRGHSGHGGHGCHAESGGPGCGERGWGGPPWARGGPEGHGPPGEAHGFGHGHGFGGHGFGGGDEGGFGVRRPLRFLAYKLELSEAQVGELAGVLDTLKIERAQAAVDQRRTTASLADTLEAGTFDEAKAAEAGAERSKSAERVQAAVVSALKRIHGLLDEEQRKKLSYLLRTGQLSI